MARVLVSVTLHCNTGGRRAWLHRRKQLGVSADVQLLPDSEEDAQGAALAFFDHGRSDSAVKKQVKW